MADLKKILGDLENLLHQAASTGSERTQELCEIALEKLGFAKQTLADVQAMVVEKGKKAATLTDEAVRQHPWKALGIASGVGFVLGLLVKRGQ